MRKIGEKTDKGEKIRKKWEKEKEMGEKKLKKEEKGEKKEKEKKGEKVKKGKKREKGLKNVSECRQSRAEQSHVSLELRGLGGWSDLILAAWTSQSLRV